MSTINTQHLCRGKRLDGGGWVEGYYACIAGEVHVIFTGQIDITTIATEGGIRWERFEVDPATIGRCTGLVDKGGKLIFDADIAYIADWDCYAKVYWCGGGWMLYFGDSDEYLAEHCHACEIVGTIHDNPEMCP